MIWNCHDGRFTSCRRRRKRHHSLTSWPLLTSSMSSILLILLNHMFVLLLSSHFNFDSALITASTFNESTIADRKAVLNDDRDNDNINRANYTVYLIIEGTVRPYFQCIECYHDLIQEQEYIVHTIQSSLQPKPNIQVLDTSYKFMNSIYVQITTGMSSKLIEDNVRRDSDNAGMIGRRTRRIVSQIEQLKVCGIKKVYISQYHLLKYNSIHESYSYTEEKEQNRRRLQNEDGNDGGEKQSNDTFQDIEYSKPLRSVGVDVAHKMTSTMMIQDSKSNEYHPCSSNITGHGIRIAILDGGIDYTHESLGGIGTKQAYTDAYGTSIYDIRNTQRDTYFPTSVVIDGYDIIGDKFKDGDPAVYAISDDDPIDLSGHGTAVAHVIRSVAPNAKLIAIKICTTIGSTCPDFAFVRGMEYILDRNHDGVVDTDVNDVVHVVNLSLGRMYASGYYSVLSKITEEIVSYGIVAVLSSSNYGNIPFILGDAPATPNAITVGATVVDYETYDDDSDVSVLALSRSKKQDKDIRIMAPYSSRGPVSEGNRIKPDLVSPGGPYRLAQASTGDEYRSFQGTSFAAPFVAGGAALLKQKCKNCSPLAIKALLMNHAVHTIYAPAVVYNESSTSNNKDNGEDTWAPVTLQGSGEMQIHKSLMATYWVYCVDDMNPSISLGLINAATSTFTIKRTLRLNKISNTADTLSLRYELRSPIHRNAISIEFMPESIVFNGHDCDEEYLINITFTIDTQYAPSNHMYSGGAISVDPHSLDYNEIDGWIFLSSDDDTNDDKIEYDDRNNVTIPFHMLLRKAANVSIGTTTFEEDVLHTLPKNVTINIENHGMETAQIDSYQLIYLSTDQSESDFGSNKPPADIRYVGYRTISVPDDHESGCHTLIEFAVQTWESQQSLSFTHFNIWIDLNFDETAEHTIYNSAYRLGSKYSEMRRIDLMTNIEYCIGFTPDHITNTANTVLRFCSNDIGINTAISTFDTIISVAITSYSFPDDEVADVMEYRNITIPHVGLAAPSYDVEPGAILQNILLSGTGTTPLTMSSTNYDDFSSTLPLGILLFTNSFRSWTSTGSATRNSEAIVILRHSIVPPQEFSPDTVQFPVVKKITGPLCDTWQQLEQIQSNSSSTTQKCHNSRRTLTVSTNVNPILPSLDKYDNMQDEYTIPKLFRDKSPSSTKTNIYRSAFLHDSIKISQLMLHRYDHRIVQVQEICPELKIPRVRPIVIVNSVHDYGQKNNSTSSPITVVPSTAPVHIDQADVNEDENGNDNINFPSDNDNNHFTSSNTKPPLTIVEVDDENDNKFNRSWGVRPQSSRLSVLVTYAIVVHVVVYVWY